MLSRRAAVALLPLMPFRSVLAQWPAESYRNNTYPGPATPKPKPSPRPRAVAFPKDPGGIIYAADAEPSSLTISQQVAMVLGEKFQAEPSRGIAASVERLSTSAPDVAWAVLPATTVGFLEKNSLKGGRSICFIARVGVLDLHVIATPPIRHVSELAERKVNLGPNGSQNQITASLLLDSASVHVEPLYNDHERALSALMQGQIAAMILLAEKPSDILFAAHDVHFLPVDKGLRGCVANQILPGDYPLLGGGESGRGRPVDTLAVPLVLASYDWPTDSKEFFATARVADLLSKHRSLEEMSINVQGWQRFGPVAEWLSHGGHGSIMNFANHDTAARNRPE